MIGVLPDRFHLLQHAPDLVLPLRLDRAQTQIGLFRYQGIARLKWTALNQRGEAVYSVIPLAIVPRRPA